MILPVSIVNISDSPAETPGVALYGLPIGGDGKEVGPYLPVLGTRRQPRSPVTLGIVVIQREFSNPRPPRVTNLTPAIKGKPRFVGFTALATHILNVALALGNRNGTSLS